MFKRMKRLLRLRSNSGFTLIEMIIACALLGVLIVGMMGFTTPIMASIRVKEKDARAEMLSEAIDSYIASSTQYAFYVQTIDAAASIDTISAAGAEPNVYSLKYNGSKYKDQKGNGLAEMVDTMKKLPGDTYEIRCIGMRWMEVLGGGGEKKLMLTNEKVDQATCALDPKGYKTVFEAAFYDGLYPIVRIENFTKQIDEEDEDEDADIAPAMKVITDVYLTPDCYSTDENVRNKALKACSGMIYADFFNIRSPIVNNGKNKIIPTISVHSTTSEGDVVPNYAGAYAADPAGSSYVEDGKNYYYPNTFIYYIARKNRVYENPTPTT